MSKPKAMPDDIRKECLLIVAGYDRRVRSYYDKRREIIEGTPQRHIEIGDQSKKDSEWAYLPSGHEASRNAENIAMALVALDDKYETKKIKAVEYARERIGADIEDPDLKRRLISAIMLNCTAGKRYPYNCFDLTGIEKTNFYDRRTDFLISIARYLEML